MSHITWRRIIGGMLIIVSLIAVGGWNTPASAENPRTHPRQDGDNLPLDATYTAEDGSFTFAYPGDWLVEQTAPNEIAVTDPDAQVAIIFTWGTSQVVAGSNDKYPQDILFDYLFANPSTAYLTPYRDTLGGETIAWVDDPLGDGSERLYLLFPVSEGIFGLMIAAVQDAGLDALRPTLLAMVVSAMPGGQQATEPTGEALPLTETHTMESGYSFSYPQGWETEYELNEPDIALVSLGSNDSVASNGSFNYDFAPGDVWVSFNWEALDHFSDVDTTSSPVDVLNASTIRLYPDMEDTYEIQLGDHTAAIAEGVHSSGTPMMALFFFWDEDTIAWFLALTAPGEYDQFKPTLLAIAESMLPGESANEATTGSGPLTQVTPETSADTVPPPLTGVLGRGEEIRQWALRAEATSEYSAPNWSAQQATGAPDTGECGDIQTAWASSEAAGVDALTVFFATPVIPKQINIYQTYNPGAITSVELIPAGGGRTIQVPNSADTMTGCPGVFTVDVPERLTEDRPIIGVKIRLDQRNHTGWNEIDAVELVGTTVPGETVPDSSSTDLPPLPVETACDIRTRSRVVNMRGGPGTDFNIAGQVRPNMLMTGNGQTTGSDGFTWWRLTYGGWVRADVVDAANNCSARLPFVTADDSLPLTLRYTTPDGRSFDYPQDWVVIAEPGGATVGNSLQAAQKSFGDAYNAGEFQASIRWLTIDELAPDTGLATGATPMQVLRAAISVSEGIDMNEPYELQIGSDIVAAAYGTFDDTNVEIAVVIFDAGNGLYGSVLTGSDLRGLEQFEPTLRAIIGSALAGSN